jgi:GxxExxY protein
LFSDIVTDTTGTGLDSSLNPLDEFPSTDSDTQKSAGGGTDNTKTVYKTNPASHLNHLSHKVIGACINVHRELGPGLLESAYEECVCHELYLAGLTFERQKPLSLVYKGIKLDCGYRLDVVIENRIILELKAVETLMPIHEAQVLTYLKLSKLTLGLLINFNVPVLKQGLKRLVNQFPG